MWQLQVGVQLSTQAYVVYHLLKMVKIAQKDIDIKCGVRLVSSLSHRHNIYITLSIIYQVYSNGRKALVHLAIRGYMMRWTTTDDDDGRTMTTIRTQQQKNSISIHLNYILTYFPFTHFRNRFQDFLLRFQHRLLQILAWILRIFTI